MNPMTALGASTVAGAAGTFQKDQASAAAAGFNAKVASQNAALETQNANMAGAVGEANLAALEQGNRAKMGTTLAVQGRSGIDVNKGSAVDVRSSEAAVGALNAMQLRSDAVRQAYGYQVASANDTMKAQQDRMLQSNEKTSSYIDAGTTILGGAAKGAQYADFLSKNPASQLANTDNTNAGNSYMNV